MTRGDLFVLSWASWHLLYMVRVSSEECMSGGGRFRILFMGWDMYLSTINV